MTNLAILSMGKEVLLLGIGVAIFTVVLFSFMHFIIYKKCMKGTKQLRVEKVVLCSTFIIYLVVVLGATLLRPGYMESAFYWRIFSSYKAAWVSGSYTEWRNLILNIMMFVPLGIYIPIVFQRLNKFYKVYLVGLLLSVSIEIIQWKVGSGVGEMDDIFNNTLGTMIGYGIFVLIYRVVMGRTSIKKYAWKSIFCYQIPIIITIISFAVIYVVYQQKEFGVLTCEPTYVIQMNNVDVSTKLDLSSEGNTENVYEIATYNVSELVDISNTILKEFGTSVDSTDAYIYEETVVFKSVDGRYSLWIDYAGGSYWITDYHLMDVEEKFNLTESEVRDILEEKGIDIPEDAIFSISDGAGYRFEVDTLMIDNKMIDGYFTCRISVDNELKDISNYIKQYEWVTEVEIISSEEVYNKICNGDFSMYQIYKLENSTIEISTISIEYLIDSKGFYQPVYIVNINSEDMADFIFIPALKQ